MFLTRLQEKKRENRQTVFDSHYPPEFHFTPADPARTIFQVTAEPVNRPADLTLGQLLTKTRDYLAQKGVDDPRLSAEVLLAHAAGCRRIDLYTRFEQPLEPTRLSVFREHVRRAATHEPIAYLVGEKEFLSMSFRVSKDVLIPRPETEVLVECALDHVRSAGLDAPTFLDIGTGSGCIPIALLKLLPQARAVATDISAAALAVARSNMEKHGVGQRLTLVEADGLGFDCALSPDGGFDVILSNPPYVSQEEFQRLGDTVRRFEPQTAITDGQDGLSMYRVLSEGAAKLLRPEGLLMVEMADGAVEAVVVTVTASGRWEHRRTITDRVVGQPRVAVFAPAR